jgi:ABC-type multidrug transport system fused ATPase/permease subunit
MQHSKIEASAIQQKQHPQYWKVIKNLLPYISAYKARIIFALLCLMLAKAVNLGVPIMLKNIVDAMSTASTPI